jgi:hypothetical protein
MSNDFRDGYSTAVADSAVAVTVFGRRSRHWPVILDASTPAQGKPAPEVGCDGMIHRDLPDDVALA